MVEEDESESPAWGRAARSAVLLATILLPIVVIALVYEATRDLNTSVAIFAVADPWRLAFAAGTVIAPFATAIVLAPLASQIAPKQRTWHDDIHDELNKIRVEREQADGLAVEDGLAMVRDHEERLGVAQRQLDKELAATRWTARGAMALIVVGLAFVGLIAGGWPLAGLYASIAFVGLLWSNRRSGWIGLEFLERTPLVIRIAAFFTVFVTATSVINVFPTAKVTTTDGTTKIVALIANDIDGYWYIEPTDRATGTHSYLAWQVGPVESIVVCSYRWNQCQDEHGESPSPSPPPSPSADSSSSYPPTVPSA